MATAPCVIIFVQGVCVCFVDVVEDGSYIICCSFAIHYSDFRRESHGTLLVETVIIESCLCAV